MGILADSLSDNDLTTYELVVLDTTSIINRHVLFLKTALKATEIPETLPFLYWIVKMHKIPSKQRYIAASSCCSTKPLSEALTKCFEWLNTNTVKFVLNITRHMESTRCGLSIILFLYIKALLPWINRDNVTMSK